METLKRVYHKDVAAINNLIKFSEKESNFSKKIKIEVQNEQQKEEMITLPKRSSPELPSMKPIGYLRSCFKSKNGTPRQPSICSFAKGCLQISKSVFDQPEHSLQGLASFSHVWILFAFHDNGPRTNFTKSKVKPPRLDGEKIGLFSTRSPHRPNPIGLSLAKLDKIQGDTIYVSGIDIIDNTPIYDIKPYVPMYDRPDQAFRTDPSQEVPQRVLSTDSCYDGHLATSSMEGTTSSNIERTRPEELSLEGRIPDGTKLENVKPEEIELPGGKPEGLVDDVKVADWIAAPPIQELKVRFTHSADMQLEHFTQSKDFFEYFTSAEEAKQAIAAILAADPRSSYRRKACQDKLYYFTVDNIHVTAWFGNDFAEVLQVQSDKEN
ncbi:tRNA (adenine(37)-N6)-methyltransferase-like [Antedon mediterranea]|uniref:tRNA (adenine(37)-N6)-methyltransferase-like n=1 Tax=Antedon mediterranea TaxID=105859 RepID=UPI003AF795B5